LNGRHGEQQYPKMNSRDFVSGSRDFGLVLDHFLWRLRERPVATQHSLSDCVDHLAALSHIGYPIRCELGLLCTLIDQSRGNDSITLRFFRCPGVFAIAIVSFSSLNFLTFAKYTQLQLRTIYLITKSRKTFKHGLEKDCWKNIKLTCRFILNRGKGYCTP